MLLLAFALCLNTPFAMISCLLFVFGSFLLVMASATFDDVFNTTTSPSVLSDPVESTIITEVLSDDTKFNPSSSCFLSHNDSISYNCRKAVGKEFGVTQLKDPSEVATEEMALYCAAWKSVDL